MEGPLSKWTNVMKGWQYRWFVLDHDAGLLSYYTSKDKMVKGSRRGCVRLKGAIIGIDDEDDSMFTITVDQKTFHFQARDQEERERWIEALERAICQQSGQPRRDPAATFDDFEKKLMETDAYLQLLIEQNQALEKRIGECPVEANKERYNVITVTADAMIEAIKHSIVQLQISKEKIRHPKFNSDILDVPLLTDRANFSHFNSTIPQDDDRQPSAADESIPVTSYSSSEDEEFYDAEEQKSTKESGGATPVEIGKVLSEENSETESFRQDGESANSGQCIKTPVILAEEDYFDELYDVRDDEDLGSMEQHGSVVGHLLSQVRIGMDLTKIVLPTFILERRSLLEMFADFFAHADLFSSIPDMPTPKDRMVQVVKWYLSAFHAGRPSEIARKPYNPILGEVFRCHWQIPDLPRLKPGQDDQASDGPIPWATKNNLVFISEQVSHHPPISAFYAENYDKRISLDGYIWTKSKFLGLSIGVHMIGESVLSLLDHDEEYTLSFPSGYGRSILTVPWIELGGKVNINCVKTGYSALVEFHTKPFYGSKKHKVTAQVFEPNEKKAFLMVEGEWNGVMFAKWTSGKNEMFINTHTLPIIKKIVRPPEVQEDFESRKLWRNVTYYLKEKNVDKATEEKHKLEQKQRDEAKDRKERGIQWQTKYFQEVGEHWVYCSPLVKRLHKSPLLSRKNST